MKKVLSVLLAVTLILGVLPVAAFAGNGPASGEGYIGFMLPEYNYSPDYPYMQIVYEGGILGDEIEGASYDLGTNTLTLDGYNLPMSLSVVSMGDDFKIKLIGENSLDNIRFADLTGNGCSAYFIGDGSLTVNEERNADFAMHIDACGQSRPTIKFSNEVNVTLYCGEDEFGGIVKAEKVLDSDENPEPPVFVFENGQQVEVQKQDTQIFDGEIEGYEIRKMDGGYMWFGMQVTNPDDPDGLYTYTSNGYYDEEAEEWIQTDYSIRKINEIIEGAYEYDNEYEGEQFATEEELFAAFPPVKETVQDERPATLNNRITVATHSSSARVYEDESNNRYAYAYSYNSEEGSSGYYVCEFEEIPELPGEYVVTPIDGMELDGLSYTDEDIGVYSFRDDGEPSSVGNLIDMETPEGVKYTATLIEDQSDPDNFHTDWHIHKFIYSSTFDMWFQDYSFNNGEGEIEINPQDFETSEWNAFTYEMVERQVEIKSYYDLYDFEAKICEDNEGNRCAINRYADLSDEETVLYDFEDRDGVIIFTENTSLDKANFTVVDDAHVAEGVHDYSILGRSLTVAPGEDNWVAFVNIVDNEGNRYTPEDVIEIKVGEKKFFWCETDFENNASHGVTPYVGFSENDEHIWTLTPAGFKVTGGTGEELGYEGIDSFGIEVDTTGMKVATEAPLKCWLYEFDGLFPGMDGFDWNALTKTNEFTFKFAVAPNEGWNTFVDGHNEYIKDGVSYKGLKKVGSYYYYFDANGKMLTGWQNIKRGDGKTYKHYFNTNGTMALGWQSIKNSKGVAYKYYFGTNGCMVTGWQSIKNSKGVAYKYYFHTNGVMLTGWQTIGGKKYYLGTNGVMVTGWQKIKNAKGVAYQYYFGTNGVMATGWQTIKNAKGVAYKYYFNPSNGVMPTGWQKIKNAKGVAYQYYFASNGVMATGWQKIKASNGKTYWYYFGTNGVMVANKSLKIGSKTYKFNKSGVCTNR